MSVNPHANIDYWYPLLHPIVLMPDTMIIHTKVKLEQIIEKPLVASNLVKQIQEAALTIGYPVILRTGYCAFKKNWNVGCYLTAYDDPYFHVRNLMLRSMEEQIPYDVWAVRRFVAAKAYYTLEGGAPIQKELRVITRGDQVIDSWVHLDSAFSYLPTGVKTRDEIVKEIKIDPEDGYNLLRRSRELGGRLSSHGSHIDVWAIDWLEGKIGTTRRWCVLDVEPVSSAGDFEVSGRKVTHPT